MPPDYDKKFQAIETKQIAQDRAIDRLTIAMEANTAAIVEIKGYAKKAFGALFVSALAVLVPALFLVFWLGIKVALRAGS